MVGLKKQKVLKNQRGMTLIELLAVVIILGIIATIAGVAVVNASERAKVNSDTTTISVLKDAAQRYILDNDIDEATLKAGATITAEELVEGLYLLDIPVDSVKNIFHSLEVKVSDAVAGPPAAPASIDWQFHHSAAKENEFALKATNR